MEEKETWESEPVDLQCAEQTDLVSLIISGEEEAAQEDSDLGHYSGGEEDATANGHIGEESEGGVATPISSPGTSYWSITEGPDHPLLLSPAAGPAGRKPRRVQRASRPGLSRIPGRDHRRYYHEYWRMEYLMDFDPRRHGMICMVCGSSLATLKLSTIKRHIRQKHPDSLLWSTADKEVIRSGWESHLGLEGAPLPPPLVADTVMGEQPTDSGAQQTTGEPSDPTQADPSTLCLSPPSPVDEDPPPEEEHRQQGQQEEEEEEEEAGPSAQTLERYLNDSLHAWFRQEFLMEYEAEAGRLLCMVCGGQLPSLHLDHIKGHVLHSHPGSLVYSSEEKHCILQAWAHAHEEANNVFIKSESNTKDSEVSFFSQGTQSLQTMAEPHRQFEGALTQGASLTGEDRSPNRAPPPPPPPPATPPSGRPPRKRRLRTGEPWRLRLDYLVAYGPQGRGTYCMVCSQMLLETKVTSFRRHIQVCHPETTTLSRQEREAMAAAWTKDDHTDDTRIKEEPHPIEASDVNPSEEASSDGRSGAPGAAVKTEDGGDGRGKARDGNHSGPSRHGHYPGKDQRRNYQARWRMEYLMDYDWRRHGLICMVCGATLATLKVSTIKRHIQQVHPRSLEYGPAEKQRALLAHGHGHADTMAVGDAPNHVRPGGRFSPNEGGAAPALAQGHFGT